ncbi:dimethyladenosine transferase [Cyclonatronum proteinivorum]|uniref:Ribosomal RNA small subunit methyltransferase A n=1 Tax=Cyclonatronum proteinivorum TaxID=1457365 RepID=A0A345UK08_9BACT|nr:16S rRNA (adenine(1518)-N(6)/adenine(1519)-N(6))-dimethyltransferase RsmA [Cyclonatronum proteinivorum]AXJ00810.1 dimethyladenosine transferase [Cyclonatronum proteinivorum]
MNLRPKKSLGQHFLRDQNILRKIALSAGIQKGDRVIEIGPGEGALTEYLLSVSDDVCAVEVDPRAVELLRLKFLGLDVRHADFLSVELDALLEAGRQHVIIGNIPYNITSPILFKVMDAGPVFRRAVFLMQKEVAERLVARPGSKAYGILSVQAQLLGTVAYLFDVSRHVFFPKPKVESGVITFTPRESPLEVPTDQLKTVVRMAFNQRRKKMSNSLKSLIAEHKPDGVSFDLNLRPDQLTPPEFITLTQAIFEP